VSYLLAAGHPAPGDMPWPEFLLYAKAESRVEAKALSRVMLGTAWGAASVFGGKQGARDRERALREVLERADPRARPTPRIEAP